MSDIYNTFPYYGYGTEDGSAYYKKPQPMDGEAVENAIDEKISDLVGNAPSDLDTIEELAAAVQTGSGDASDIYAKIDEVEAKIPTTVEELTDASDYAKTTDIPTSLEGLDNSKTKYQSEDEVDATVGEAIENLFASVEYDTDNKQIIFKNEDGTQVGLIDATDFIKDGMVSDVAIEEGKLVITFNEESGTQDIELNLSDIFDPENYYTKNEAASKEDIVDFITEEEADDKYQPKGEYQEAGDYALKSELPDLTDYATKNEIPDVSGFATTESVNEAIGAIVIPVVPENVSDFNNDANYTTLDAVAAEGYTKFDGDYNSLENKPVIPVIPTNVSDFTNDADYLNKETADTYYQPIGNYANETDIESTVHELVVRLNKLEAQNAVLVEKGTDSAEDIANMQDTENEDVVLATNSAIEALATPMTFNSVSIVGGEVGDDTVINTIAKDSVDINGLTVSGGYPEDENHNRLENGKIKYATREINISNLNIEPGCTVYNVFEGSQDMTADHSIDKFTAKNVTVNDTDLEHNVFNIYQLNSDAEVLIEDSTFNLNVAKSNVMRISNITNAENVTVTFKNIDLTYENKPYTSEDAAYAGLVIYQAYGNDLAFAGDTSKIGTWTFNFINCRYNGEVVTTNEVGTIRQLMYQYHVNNQGCEAPSAFDSVVVSVE